MIKVTLKLTSAAPYSQSKHYEVPKKEKESAADYEERTWRERLHVTEDGEVFIPPMALKNCLAEAAKYLSEQIKGKGKATYTKHFEAGVLVMDALMLGVKKDAVKGEKLFVPADGKRGGSKRVWKFFPVIPKWEAVATVWILDQTITRSVFERHIRQAGRFIGMGRFRPRNNGIYGRFDAEIVAWEEAE